MSTPSPYSRDPVDELVLPVAARPELRLGSVSLEEKGREGPGFLCLECKETGR